LKNILILLVMAVSLATLPTVGHANADSDSFSEAPDETGVALLNARPRHGHESQDSDCCHNFCVCCTAQSFLITAIQFGGSVSTGKTTRFKSTNYSPNPHLEGLLRPPRFS